MSEQKNVIPQSRRIMAKVSLIASVITILLLTSLLFLSPEFDPSFRPISDYALGDYGWVLSLMFFSWAVSAWALVVAITPHLKTIGGKIGLVFLALAGLGEMMGGLFDVTHPLHGAAFFIGVPCLPIAAIIISLKLSKSKPWSQVKKSLLWTANLTWISVVLMPITIAVMFIGLTNAGITPGPEVKELPDNVISLFGWANRLLVVLYCTWTATVAYYTLKLHK
jgi:hypothetical protein